MISWHVVDHCLIMIFLNNKRDTDQEIMCLKCESNFDYYKKEIDIISKFLILSTWYEPLIFVI